MLFGVCTRCDQANARLPAGPRQKRLNAAGALAASDTTGRYWSARFPAVGAAHLAAHLLGNPTTGRDAAKALGWIE
ncbi:hypothetical protein [Thauera aromatica]|uniref:Uncharacterized protein n=1 Tax=Thauera aromatica K172 TaxID=44139 RepID=A0A2R4BQB2_THAAR|nr:hypothetical protein [Thauera aromatica]AVR89528.1 hypothetical protein Tharo_2640 [Thauera aromatica K172]